MTFEPDWTIPPGETLREVLHERGISQTELAREMGYSLKHVNGVCTGRVTEITPHFALALETALGDPSAEFWMRLDADHRLDVARGRTSL